MESLAARWQSYFESACQSDLTSLAQEFPSRQSITVDLVAVYEFDQQLARTVLEYPDRSLSEARAVLRDAVDIASPVHIQVQNNPHQCAVPDIAAHQLHELLTVRGTVESVDALEEFGGSFENIQRLTINDADEVEIEDADDVDVVSEDGG